MNKYKYLKVIQQYYAGYWEDVSEYETDSTGFIEDKAERECFRGDIKEYRFTGYPTRSINRRESQK